MLNSEEVRTSYAGNGTTTDFPFPYKFQDVTDLDVYLVDNTTKTPDLQDLVSEYDVTGLYNPADPENPIFEFGGTVVFVTAPASGKTVVILRNTPDTQDTALTANDSYSSDVIEAALDKKSMNQQFLRDRSERSVRLPDAFSDTFDPRLPDQILADKVLAVNSDGDGFTLLSDVGESTIEAAASAAQSAASATLAETSATAAAASAAQAANVLTSAPFRDVVYITSADSPFTVTSSHNGKIISVNSSGGAVAISLPGISGLTLPFNVTFVLRTAGNNVTITRNGSDTIAGATTKVLSLSTVGCHLVADTDQSPDDWAVLELGSVPDSSVTLAKLATQTASPFDLFNFGFSTSIGASALTGAVKDKSGSDASSSSPVYVSMRNSTVTTGTFNTRSITAALSLTITANATLGAANGVERFLYWYLIDNSGTLELAVSGTRYSSTGIISTTTMSSGATSKFTMYSGTGRSNVPYRLVARTRDTQSTAGTYAANVSEIDLNTFTFNERQIEISAQDSTGGSITNTGSATSFADLPNTPTLTFTAARTGAYKVYTNIPTDTVNGDQFQFRINNSAGSAVLTLLQRAKIDNTASSGSGEHLGTVWVYAIYWLTEGTSYSFKAQGAANSSTGTVDSNRHPYAIVAEQI